MQDWKSCLESIYYVYVGYCLPVLQGNMDKLTQEYIITSQQY